MNKKQIHETAITFLKGNFARTQSMINSNYKLDSVKFNLFEFKTQLEFAFAINVISSAEYQYFKNELARVDNLIEVLEES